MAWQTPKTNWAAADGVRNTDFNRIEGNTLELYNTAQWSGRYNSLTGVKTAGSNQVITTTPVPTSGWVAVTNGTVYTNGNYRITANSYNGNIAVAAHMAVDGNASTIWASDSENISTFMVTLPSALTVTKAKLAYTIGNNGVSMKIQGSNDASAWTDLYTETTFNNTNVLRELTLTTTGSYKYYRVWMSKAGGSSIGEFQLSSYTVGTYSIAYTSSAIPSGWTDGQIVYVQTPAIDTTGVTINTVSGIVVDALLKQNTKYELVYRSNKFYTREVA